MVLNIKDALLQFKTHKKKIMVLLITTITAIAITVFTLRLYLARTSGWQSIDEVLFKKTVIREESQRNNTDKISNMTSEILSEPKNDNTHLSKQKNITQELKHEICGSEICIEAAFHLRWSMNTSVEPCDNFYEFVCGNHDTYNRFQVFNDTIYDRLNFLLLKTPNENTEYLNKLYKYHKLCVEDDEKINQSRIEYFKTILNNLGDWPILDSQNTWNESNFEWKKIVHKFRQIGFNFNFFVGLSIFKNFTSGQKMIILSPPLSTMKPYQLRRGLEDPSIKKYLNTMVRVAKSFGAEGNVREQLEEMLRFEIKLNKIVNEAQNIDDMETMSVKTFQSKYSSGIQWLDYLNGILSPHIKISESETILVGSTYFFKKFSDLMINEKPTNRVLANFAFFNAVLSFRELLYADPRRTLSKSKLLVTNNNYEQAKQRECLYSLHHHMKFALNSLYIKNHFNSKIIEPIVHMSDEIRESLMKLLLEVDWLHGVTKMSALSKVSSLIMNIGYPPELLDDIKLNDYYRDFVVDNDNFLNSTLNLNLFTLKKALQNFREPYNTSDWFETFGDAISVVSQYSKANVIFIPVGSIQKSSFDPNLPNYLNYGKLGFSLSRTMAYTVSPKHRLYTSERKLMPWNKESRDMYLNKTRCLIQKYNNYESDNLDFRVSGVYTLNENFADIGGLKAAYKAYEKSQKKKKDKLSLPGLEKYSPQQLFWMSYASNWCNKRQKYYAHFAPDEVRVIVPVSSLEEFSRDFGCAAKDRMNPVERCHVW